MVLFKKSLPLSHAHGLKYSISKPGRPACSFKNRLLLGKEISIKIDVSVHGDNAQYTTLNHEAFLILKHELHEFTRIIRSLPLAGRLILISLIRVNSCKKREAALKGGLLNFKYAN